MSWRRRRRQTPPSVVALAMLASIGIWAAIVGAFFVVIGEFR